MDFLVKMKTLIKEIEKNNKAYYTLDNPIISDAEYDKLIDELKILEKEANLVLPNSPTLKVGGKILKGFKKVKHVKKLYSLEKCTNAVDLANWANDLKVNFDILEFTLEYKFDGLRIVLTYDNGNLIQASTRGNGVVGEDVTTQIMTIKSVPKTITFKEKLIVAGEALMRKSVLNDYNKTTLTPLKNPRNAAAGAIRNLDENITKSRNLDLFLYDIVYIKNIKFVSQIKEHEFLSNLGFLVSDYFYVDNNIQQLIKRIDKLDKEKDDLDILIDGAVIKINDIKKRDDIGYTAKFPKWAIAYKFKPEELTSKVLDIIWQVGRTGKITPIAIIEPIELAGAIVRRATLNNMSDIIRKDVKINSRVFVRRSNEVIPEILGIAEHNKDSIDIIEPQICPSCGKNLIQIGANLFCKNENCFDQILQKITHFVSRNAMNIDGINEKTIAQLINLGKVKTFADLYNLKISDLQLLENFKEKRIENFFNSIEKSRNVDLSNFIFSLGILNVGEKTSKDLAKKFKNLSNLINAKYNELLNIDDIGPIIADSIVDYFKEPINVLEITLLINNGVRIKDSDFSVINSIFTNKLVLLTGSLEKYTRDEATLILEKLGAKVVGSVSKNTDIVIYGASAGGKLTKAKELGIMLMTEDVFIKSIKDLY